MGDDGEERSSFVIGLIENRAKEVLSLISWMLRVSLFLFFLFFSEDIIQLSF